jgi:hypothetical protein
MAGGAAVSRGRARSSPEDQDGQARSLTLYREAVIDNAETLTAVEFKVLLVMSGWMDFHDLGGCYPGVREVAEQAGMSRISVQRAQPALVAKGWLVRLWRGGLHGPQDRRASIYRGAVPAEARGQAALKLRQRGSGLRGTGKRHHSDDVDDDADVITASTSTSSRSYPTTSQTAGASGAPVGAYSARYGGFGANLADGDEPEDLDDDEAEDLDDDEPDDSPPAWGTGVYPWPDEDDDDAWTWQQDIAQALLSTEQDGIVRHFIRRLNRLIRRYGMQAVQDAFDEIDIDEYPWRSADGPILRLAGILEAGSAHDDAAAVPGDALGVAGLELDPGGTGGPPHFPGGGVDGYA